MRIWPTLLAAGLALAAPPLGAAQVTDELAIGGVLSAAVQCQWLSGKTNAPDSCRGAAPFQPDLTYRPTAQDEIFLKLGLAAGNALNPVSPFAFAPWNADLQADVRHINGRNRSYLLEAWYSRTFELAADSTLEVTGGIIDPAFYVDENAYANNEYTQFMNGAFVNDREAFLPAYDWGSVLVWKYQDWTFSGIGMNVGENSAGRNYNFYAAEADYHIETPLGEGNYRVMYSGSSKAFPNAANSALERRAALSLSFDQALGEGVGAFLRLGWQSDSAAVDFKALYSGGLDLKGGTWGREGDNIGIAYAYLPGGSSDLIHSHVFETYYRLAVDEHLALTADLQYMDDRYRDGEHPKGWIAGLRLTLEF